MKITNYSEWRHCIEIKCGIELTNDYVQERIKELADINNTSTNNFITLYGDHYRLLISSWFLKAADEIKKTK